MNYKRRIKKSFFYTNFIKFIFYPMYNILWEYFINFEAKCLFYFWKLKNRGQEYFNLDNNDQLLIKDDKNFKELSKKIFDNSLKHLNETKKTLLSEEHREKMMLVHGKNGTDATTPYRISLFEKLDENLRKEIVKFASSNKMISTAANHMKIFPILTRIQVSLNIPRENSDLRGAMFWHRDTFGFKNLDFFMYISDVDDENGPFYFLKEKIKASTFMNFENLRPYNLPGERGKVDITEFSKYFSDEKINKVTGDSGTAVFLDSFSTYHRGGFCKSRDRIALRFCYQSHDAFYTEPFTKDNKYIYDKDISCTNVNSRFHKYLFFKKKSKIIKFVSSFLLKFYRRIDFILT